ncbi:peptidoglycan/LPS O-acetylase OafA/YrhL [Dysgonomonas sp. PH5-45]|uniref:acyltransferase family protein n=1 Tax=unclassified Dysgonomonas TaxID=2630389 RepID=UPI00247494B9|nr:MULTISPECIES: acyltransferase [unclassified Dysgonomonas]MDH6354098.1 peptidoglycan/LPS O-acetylase OafA/YrhL [Dysgonomonas sp. PH5-45]MDH6387051.1 peptidoglycan/LPS O-acetylase OafA/YrhL [Dysgonomonas sp. PH5-37]
MEPKKYEYIDSLRGIAVLMVILVHIGNMLLPQDEIQYHYPEWLCRIISAGRYGVQLFFIVSALTLFMSHNNRKGETQPVKKFFIRRFFRIAPMYYLAIIYFTFDQFIGFDFSNLDFSLIPLKALLSSILFVNSLFPFYANLYVPGGWSVSVEFIFYLFVPFLCSKISNVNKSISFAAIAFVVGAIISSIACYYLIPDTVQQNSDDGFAVFNFFVQFPVFTLGFLCYRILNNNEEPIRRSTLALMLAAFVFFFFFMPIPKHLLFSLILLILVVIQARKPFKILSNKVLAKVGKVSFSMYLVHFAIIHALNNIGFNYLFGVNDIYTSLLNFVLMYLLVSLITYLVSSITYKYIEVKGQNIGRQIIKTMDKKES